MNTQSYNRRLSKVGHLFQGRFKAILVDTDAYLLEVCRYVDLNPARAPDFLIGAHAVIERVPLLNRDVRRYRNYFPGLQLICP